MFAHIDTALLSRIQFAFTISFHILFPAFSIGLATFLAIMEGIWLKTKKAVYLQICKFWTKVFALTFGMGIVSGIVMEFQFGTNWSGFTHAVGGVLGALFTYEVMTAFFIEAGFLGVMLFGWKRVGPRLHYLSTLLVAIGTTISAYWILAANTWMQHPVGYSVKNGIFSVSSWTDIIFNPGILPRFLHMMLAAYISAGFVIVSISAFYLLKRRHATFAKSCFSFVWLALLILVPSQIIVGDLAGLAVQEHQPIKTAAMEGLWETTKGAPLLLFAIPDQKHQRNKFEIGIPHIASLLNTHRWNGELQGLKTVAASDQPKVAVVFWGFRIMVFVGLVMLLAVIVALYLRLKRQLYQYKWFLRASLLAAPLGFIALWFGWITTEMGRQPWIVYQLLRTVKMVSQVPLHNVIISMALIVIVYGIVFGYFYFHFLNKLIHKGPDDSTELAKQPFDYMQATAAIEVRDNR